MRNAQPDLAVVHNAPRDAESDRPHLAWTIDTATSRPVSAWATTAAPALRAAA